MKFIITTTNYKLCNEGLFKFAVVISANGKLKRDAWIRIWPLKTKYVPPVVRSKEDLKAEGDRLMGIKKNPRPVKEWV